MIDTVFDVVGIACELHKCRNGEPREVFSASLYMRYKWIRRTVDYKKTAVWFGTSILNVEDGLVRSCLVSFFGVTMRSDRQAQELRPEIVGTWLWRSLPDCCRFQNGTSWFTKLLSAGLADALRQPRSRSSTTALLILPHQASPCLTSKSSAMLVPSLYAMKLNLTTRSNVGARPR